MAILTALQDEWAQHPPAHLLIAAYLKYEPPLKKGDKGDLRELIGMFSNGVIK